MIIVGVDPGVSGAIVQLGEGESYSFWPMPTERDNKSGRDRYSITRIRNLFEAIDDQADRDDERLVVFVERAAPFPHGEMGGALANFHRGVSFGLFAGILAALRIEHELVAPQTWQREMLRDVEDKGDTKARALAAVTKLMPRLDVSKLRSSPRGTKAHSGLVDALLLALFGRWRMLGSIRSLTEDKHVSSSHR